jgi:hypothetical protein
VELDPSYDKGFGDLDSDLVRDGQPDETYRYFINSLKVVMQGFSSAAAHTIIRVMASNATRPFASPQLR